MPLTRPGTRGRALPLLLAAALASLSCDYLGVEGFSSPSGEGDASAAAAVPTAGGGGPIAAFADSIPTADVPDLDLQMALTLVAMPLSCVDRPHAAPRDRSTYLDEIVAERRPGYERNRSFYGCWDWHSAVNSTWAMVRLYKEFPRLPIGGLITEKLADHLSAAALQGELEFFQESATFERPYGWGWLLRLYSELRGWDHPDAQQWADNLEPLATMFSERMVSYLPHLERPERGGAHGNTAFSLAMMLDYARTMDDVALQEAVGEATVRLYTDDLACPTAYEPWGSDFLSPCLEEAALMSEVLDPEAFVAWFGQFMPEVTSREFLPLTTPIDTSAKDDEEKRETADQAGEGGPRFERAAPDLTAGGAGGAGEQAAAEGNETAGEEVVGEPADEEQRLADEALRELASRSHVIGLAFVRADAMNRIAAALPAGDPRIDAYRKLAALHGSMGFEAMFDADYAGSHWIGTFALKYLLTRPGR